MNVVIEYYRYAGRFLFYKAKDSCLECEMTYSILHRLEAELFTGKNITLIIKPFFNNIIPLIFRKGFKPPLVYVNGKLFSQGIVPDTVSLIETIGNNLEDQDLVKEALYYNNFRNTKADVEDLDLPLIYFSPTCPHCKALKFYLDANDVPYSVKNVVDNLEARKELEELSPMMTIPVILYKQKVLYGFKKEDIDSLLDIRGDHVISNKNSDSIGPEISQSSVLEAMEGAKALLLENREGNVTKASQHLYPHQWSWDAAFISRGLLHYDQEAAYREIKSLFRGQWTDGFVPHIVFNNNYLDHFPGPDYWKGERSGKMPEDVYTSGISQPPVHASMLCKAALLDPNKTRSKSELKELYPQLKRFHDYFFRDRIGSSIPLVYLVHPWESGLDNAPLWDKPLRNIEGSSPWAKKMQHQYDKLARKGKRPSRSYIEKYSYLVESLFSRDFNWKLIEKEHPFRICDVLFNSVLCKSERDLGLIAEYIGEDPQFHYKRSDSLKKAINEYLWDENDGYYYNYDLVSKEFVKSDTVFSYLPLYGEICNKERGERLIGHLKTHCYCVADRDCMGIPSYDMCKIDYDGEFYWRGPIWFNMSWYIYHGFINYGYNDDALWLKKSMIQLVIDSGFYEYYKPENGKGLGAEGFSWTAALFLDLCSDLEDII